jgi:hypothetical protein
MTVACSLMGELLRTLGQSFAEFLAVLFGHAPDLLAVLLELIGDPVRYSEDLILHLARDVGVPAVCG